MCNIQNIEQLVYIILQAVNERDDDPDARPMLYDPLQGGKTTQFQQYLATVIGMIHFVYRILYNIYSFKDYTILNVYLDECKRS